MGPPFRFCWSPVRPHRSLLPGLQSSASNEFLRNHLWKMTYSILSILNVPNPFAKRQPPSLPHRCCHAALDRHHCITRGVSALALSSFTLSLGPAVQGTLPSN